MTSSWSRFSAWVDGLVPGRLTGDDAIRGRFFVRAWLITFPFIVMSLLGYAATGLWGQVVLNGLMAVGGLGALTYFVRSAQLERATHVSLTLATLTFGAATLAQSPPDITNVSFLAVVPLLGSFVLGPRRAWMWVVIPMAWGLLMLRFATWGWVRQDVDPSPFTSSGLNYVFMVLLVWAFARSFDEVRAHALEVVRRADRAKSVFLATISHEIRTPMNGVLGMTEVMLQDPLNAHQREQLEIIRRSGGTLVSLINDLLDLTKVDAGRLSIEVRDFALATLLSNVEGLFAAGARTKGLDFRVECQAGLPRAVRGDAVRLGQVLSNLLNNAVKFTAAGEVVLTVSSPAPVADPVTLQFSVRDTGPGITPEVLPRLFSAFEQGDSSTTRRFGGTGLGLALSQQLAGLMGSRIEVESTSGEGTTFSFRVTLPVGVAVDLTPVPPRRLPPEVRLPVLVVDDNAINLKVAASLVERAGFQVQTATNGREAVALVSQHPFSLVLMDCHMPEMDGFEATERIRALTGVERTTPIIALTASTTAEDLEACRRAGMNDTLAKPISMRALEEALGRFARLDPRAPGAVA